jgi:hypothetical protein
MIWRTSIWPPAASVAKKTSHYRTQLADSHQSSGLTSYKYALGPCVLAGLAQITPIHFPDHSQGHNYVRAIIKKVLTGLV